jgi:zinc protease
MKRLVLILLALTTVLSFSQTPKRIIGTDNNGYQYLSYSPDPLQSRTYTLPNGLKLLMTVYKDEPRIQTFIAVRAGSKYDPSNHTGLAHYLEHLMFKGTEKIGTNNWTKEKPYLDKIITLYELYGKTSDTNSRKSIYHKIDSLSLIASQYAIPNEYDRLLSEMGATGTNAFTSFEQTVYVNEIPSNELEKWVKTEAERFSSFVPRLFHTELEVVYEEKNRTLDSDYRQMNEALLNGLFPTHQYGTQTTIGTVNDLKSPSIVAIKNYYDTYYVPNNMAICMSGDFDMEKAVVLMDKYFGHLKSQRLPIYEVPTEEPIQKIIQKEVVGPNASVVSLGFRFEGFKEKRSMMAELVSMLLSNGEAGLIDINLNQKQEIQGGYSYVYRLNDYSMHVLGGKPKTGQSLEEVQKKLLNQINLLKQGDFEDWLLRAIVNDYKLTQLKNMESNKARAQALLSSFVYQEDIGTFLNEDNILETITKDDIMKFVKKYYNDNYVVVYKRQGEAKREHVIKPEISQLPINRGQESDFYKEVVAMPVKEIKPKFTGFGEIKRSELNNKIPLKYLKNKENKLFELYYVFDIGSMHDKQLTLAVSYLKYLGAKGYSAEALQKEFYKIGCSFNVSTSEKRVYVTLSGLDENMEKGVKLFEFFLKNPIADQEAYDKLLQKIMKARTDKKTNKKTIMSSGLVNYAKYGKNSPFTDLLTEDELKEIAPKDLTKKIKSLNGYTHRVLYYGPKEEPELITLVNNYHKGKETKTLPKMRTYPLLALDTPKVYFVNYDMVQSEVLILSKSISFEADIIPQAKVFNEYFGGNMSSIVFQEIRESRALAYSVYSYYSTPNDTSKTNYVVSYVGTQSDKLPEALSAMNGLLDQMPESKPTFENSLVSLKKQLATSRITKSGILFQDENQVSLGVTYDVNKNIYNYLDSATIEDVVNFHTKYVQSPARVYLVIGKKEDIDWGELKKLGKVKELSLQEVFGY